MRCFHLSVRSPHLLEVHTESLDKCYTNEKAALQTCPTREHIRTRRTMEIMLYSELAHLTDTDQGDVGRIAILVAACRLKLG